LNVVRAVYADDICDFGATLLTRVNCPRLSLII